MTGFIELDRSTSRGIALVALLSRVHRGRLGSLRDDQLMERLVHWLDDVSDRIAAESGAPVSLSHDRLIAAFPEDALASTDAAIYMQEALESLDGVEPGELACRIGLAAGSTRRVAKKKTDNLLLIGSAVERATTLAKAAADGALFADAAVVSELALEYLGSRAGRRRKWNGSEYLAGVSAVDIEAGQPPLAFYEVKWSGAELGKRNARPEHGPPERRENLPQRLIGQLQRWEGDHGFILEQNGEWFYVSTQLTASGELVDPGTRVFFVPLPPLIEGRNRVAACVVPLGAPLVGEVVKVFPERHYAFVEVRDRAEHHQHLFMHAEGNAWPVNVGDRVGFSVGENARGAIVEHAEVLARALGGIDIVDEAG